MFVVFVSIGGRGVGTAPLNADVGSASNSQVAPLRVLLFKLGEGDWGSASNGQVAPLRELLFKLGGGGLALTL